MFSTINFFTKGVTKFSVIIIQNNFSNVIKKYSVSTITKPVKMEAPKYRKNPIVTTLDTLQFQAIFNPELKTLASLFEKNNYELRIAGGAVRDLLLGNTPKDVDFATTATPEQMKEMFTKEEIRMINVNGEKHGTITARINDKENFEVTTLRVDVTTDGRHAEVKFTTDWMMDANRRDLTVNSMFLGLDGSVYDYFYGYEDLQKRKIAFVGDADTRIKEDYLRILRYFRFYGRIADQPDNHDENTLRVISQNVSGLQKISGERIWSELKKTLEGNFAGELMKTMLHVGVGKYCGLPEHPNVSEFTSVWQRCSNVKLQPVCLLAALTHDTEEILKMNERLKISANDRDLALFIVDYRNKIQHLSNPCTPLLPYKKLVVTGKAKLPWVTELLKYQNSPLLGEFSQWQIPRFPIVGNVLKQHGVTPGRQMGVILNELKSFWADENFQPDVETLLKRVPEIQSQLEEKRKK